jgi:RHS repeat-associated protein
MSTISKTGFTGAYQDPVTAAYPLGNGYRWYLPGLMRFNTPDSLSPFGAGGVNAYAYCAADPANHTDPSGQTWYSVLASKIVGDATREAASSLAAREAEAETQQEIERARLTVLSEAGPAPRRTDRMTRRRAASPAAESPPATRVRMDDAGHAAPGSSRAVGLIPPLPYEQAAASQRDRLGNDLNAFEQSMRQQVDPLFDEDHAGNPSVRRLYDEGGDFDTIIAEIERRGGMLLDDAVALHLDRLTNLEARILPHWDSERDRSHEFRERLKIYWSILQMAWDRNPANPDWQQPT